MSVLSTPPRDQVPAPAGARAAWRDGWRAFWAEPDPVLWPALLGAAAWVLSWVLVWLVLGATLSAAGARSRAALAFVLLLVLGQGFWAVLVRAALRSAGTPVLGRLPAVAGTAATIGVLLGIGFVAGPLGPVTVAVLTQFALVLVLRDGLGTVAALGASAGLLLRRPAAVLGFTALALLTLLGGLLLGVVGIVPASAVLALAQVRLVPPRAAG